ncbi:MAG: AAA family ATPase, partial [Endomicrobiia bacterium]
NRIEKQTTLHFLQGEKEKLKNEQGSMAELLYNEEKGLKCYLQQLNQYGSHYALLFDVLQLTENTPQELLKFIGIFENAILCCKEVEQLPQNVPPVSVFFILPKKMTEEQKMEFLLFLQHNNFTCKDERYIENLCTLFSYYMNSNGNLFSLCDNIHIKLGSSTTKITNLYYLTAKLSEKICSLEKQLENEAQLLNDYEDKIKTIKESISRKRTLIYEVSVELDTKTKEYNNTAKEEQLLANEIEYLNNTIQLVKNKIDNLCANREKILLRRKNAEELIASKKNTLEKKVALLNALEKEFQTLSVKIEEARVAKNNEHNKITNMQNKLTEYQEKLKNIENQLKNIEMLKVNNKQIIEQFELAIKNLKKEMEDNTLLAQQYLEYNNHLCKIEKQYISASEVVVVEIDKIKKLYTEKKNALYQTSLRLQVCNEKIDELKKLYKEEFKEEYDLGQQNYIGPNEDINVLKQKVRQCEEKIASLKSINMNAVNNLKVLEKELEILQSEYSKLSAVHNELSEFLSNLERQASSIFEDTISAISESFNKYIRKLFEGGKAKLELNRNGADYEINLNVQIPNKNIKNLESFSGGERALVSLALFFSLLELKPSPFYVLDEIDASLDDNNLSKLLGLLKEFSYNHQILMISHNKHTLNIADYIIGVTIGEGSFSRVLGINLEKALSYAN